MTKPKIKEIIVVEGKDDTKRLMEVAEVDTIETIGSAINKKILAEIKHATEVRGVVVLTDPDFAGEKIRKIIMEEVPQARHAFLKKSEAAPASKTKGRSLGVEHASSEAILEALDAVVTQSPRNFQTDITRALLSELNLLDGAHSRNRRAQVGEILRIGYPNGKQLLKRLVMFQITKKKLLEALAKLGAGDKQK